MKDTRKRQAVHTALLGLAALVAIPCAASTAAPKTEMDTALVQRIAANDQTGWSSVIVKTNASLTAGQQTQLAALNANITTQLPFIQSVALRVPTRNLKALAALPFVTHLSLDGGVKKCDEFTTGSSLATTAWQAPYSVTGNGVTVAIIDSGIQQQHADLQAVSFLGQTQKGSRVIDSVSFVPAPAPPSPPSKPGAPTPPGKPGAPTPPPPPTNMLPPDDQCGHGTHVAGIVAGDDADSYGSQYTHHFFGVAPLASLVNVRVLDANGAGTVSGVLAGIQWVIQNKAKDNIKVLNLSLGHPVGESYTTDPLCQGVEAAWRAGIVVVCAAGNEGRLDAVQNQPDNEGWGTAYGSIQSPGNDPYIITVGATKSMDGSRTDDKIATYSSRGPSRLDLVCKPDIVAPGNQVISLDVNNSSLDSVTANQIPLSSYSTVKGHDKDKTSDNYFCLSGTSMASPVVAGAAALMLQASPSLSPDTIKARLMLSADKQPGWYAADGSYDPLTYGAGYLDIPAALNSTFTATGEYAISPSLSIDASGNVTVNDDHALWGKTTVDTSHALWGCDLLWGQVTDMSALWGSHALWGKNTLASSHALWGCSVWSDHALWGCDISGVDLTSTALQGE